jgi:hypothetical protein
MFFVNSAFWGGGLWGSTGQISYLSKSGPVHHARLDVPEDLMPILKMQNRKVSLKTKDLVEANRLLLRIIAEWQREFESLSGRRSLVDADRQHAVWDHPVAVLARDESRRSIRAGEAETEVRKGRSARAHRSWRDHWHRPVGVEGCRTGTSGCSKGWRT